MHALKISSRLLTASRAAESATHYH